MGITLPTFAQLNWHTPLNAALGELQNASGIGPEDHGLIMWAYPVNQVSASAVGTSGTVRMTRLPTIAVTTTITSLCVHIATAPTTPTAGQNFVGLYDSTGARVAVSADATAAFTTVGDKVVALTAPYVAAPGNYWVGLLANAATPPAFSHSSSLATTAANFNTVAATAQFTSGPAGQTTLPVSITMASRTLSASTMWVGAV